MTSALAIPTARTTNAERHTALIQRWQLSHTSENTRRAYSRDLSGYLIWLDGIEQDPDTGERVAGLDVLEVGRAVVAGHREELSRAGLSASTIARKLSAVASFYAYAVQDEALEASPAVLVKRPTVDADTTTTTGMSKAQAEAFANAARQDGPRSAALVILLLTSGVRIGEALGANRADYTGDDGHKVLKVTRKGGKRASVVVAPPAVAALDAYLEVRKVPGSELEKYDGKHEPLFTTATGNRWVPSEAFRTITRLAKGLGMVDANGKATISPHSFRHTFATLALEHGSTLHDLQDSMGHADPRTTRRYDRARNNLKRSASYTVGKVLDL